MTRYREAVKAIGGPAAIYGLPKPVRDALQVARTQEAKARILEAYAREIPAMHCRARIA
jgi:hypothetical protein